MRTTAFITLAIASLLLSTSADARVINKRGGIAPLAGDGGRGGNGGNGGNGGTGAPGGPGAAGGPGGKGGSTNISPVLPALPGVPAIPDPAAGLAGLVPAVPAAPGLALPFGLGGPPPDKRRLHARSRPATGAETQSAGAEGQVKPNSDGAGGVVEKIVTVAGSVVPGDATGALSKGAMGGLPIGKRADSDI